MKTFKILYFFSLIVLLCFPFEQTTDQESDSDPLEPGFSEEDAEPESDSINDEIMMGLFEKYDPDGDKVYSKEDYKKMLYDLLFSTPGSEVSEEERELLTPAIEAYVDGKGKEEFTIDEIVDAFESQEMVDVFTALAMGQDGIAKELGDLINQGSDEGQEEEMEDNEGENKACEGEDSEGMCPLGETKDDTTEKENETTENINENKACDGEDPEGMCPLGETKTDSSEKDVADGERSPEDAVEQGGKKQEEL